MSDILIAKDSDGVFDISIANGQLVTTNGLDTAIYMSLFTEKRATEDQIKEPSQRRGWVGNELNDDVTYEIGSYLWLLDQAIINQDTANLGEAYISDCLQWMITDGLVGSITVDSIIQSDKIVFNLTFLRNDGSELSYVLDLWDNTILLQ